MHIHPCVDLVVLLQSYFNIEKKRHATKLLVSFSLKYHIELQKMEKLR